MTAEPSVRQERLRALLGADSVLTDPQACAPFLVDLLGRCRGRALAVVQPRTVAEVAQLLTMCEAERIGVVPHGGNTSALTSVMMTALSNQTTGLASIANQQALNRVNAQIAAVTAANNSNGSASSSSTTSGSGSSSASKTPTSSATNLSSTLTAAALLAGQIPSGSLLSILA